ncbi:CAAX prenyl protease 2 isoform X8 [Vombatus ursinus]|uniref:CAAX prenyl protease 2 isoform X8 n=1 Tax=Vombatus ursinus TaxID=29139 RepID=UPI000FFD25FF|nr:CAAX prenyl protease 2 isoform X8 [Vombatus ursinus]
MARVLACAAGCPCAPASASPAPTWAAFTCGRANCPGIILRSSSGDSPAFSWCPASPRSACCFGGSSRASRHIPVYPDGLQAGGHLPRRPAAAAADHDPVPGPPDAALHGLSLGLGRRTESGPGPPGLGTMPDGHALAAEPGDRPPDGGAGLPGLHAAHAGPLHRPGPCHLHLPPLLRRRTPDRTSPLSLFLQLHGLPRGVCSPGAPPEVPPAGGLCLGGGALSAPAAAPHGAQTVQQPPPLPAPGPNRRVSHFAVLLTSAPSLQTLTGSPAPHEKWGEG